MSTVFKDKHGRTVRTVQDTTYHPDGTGPRDADGKPITDTRPSMPAAEPAAPAADDGKATTKGASK